MTICVELTEWQVLEPACAPQLAGLSFDNHAAARQMAAQISQQQWLKVTELRQGIEICTSSYVGSLTLGDLQINIRPKINFDVLVTLFRYAYGMHDLRLLAQTEHKTESTTFQDILVLQLAAEVSRLISLGLFRRYRQLDSNLALPRGRINIHQLIVQGGIRNAEIPCRYFDRSADNVLNQALLAGLHFCTGQTSDLILRTRLRRLAGNLNLVTTFRPLTSGLIDEALLALSRLNSAYEPALRLISLLHAGTGISFEDKSAAKLILPGFLFDMNAFFEKLVTRFLAENLVGYTVMAQHRLSTMMAYAKDKNPKGRHPPTPRPDIAIFRQHTLVGLLDAKYRDLWNNPLPSDMLYQLAIYALSQATQRVATILYPTTDVWARDQVVEIRDPVRGANRAQVILRPVHLPSLADSIHLANVQGERKRRAFASALIDGCA